MGCRCEWISDRDSMASSAQRTRQNVSTPNREKKKKTACFCCGEKGHFAPQCLKLDETPHKDWVIKSDKRTGVTWGAGVSRFQTGIQWLQVHDAQDKTCLHQTKKRTNVIEQARKADFDNDLALDTSATFSSMKNENLLAGVHTVD